jgi:hypothetical protein
MGDNYDDSDDSDDVEFFKSKEEYNLTFLYMMSVIYDTVKIYYSYQVFLDNNKVLIMFLFAFYGLEGYIAITKEESKKIVVVFTSMMLINDVFKSGNQCLI